MIKSGLDMAIIEDKKSKIISTAEALSDVIPFDWDENTKIIVSKGGTTMSELAIKNRIALLESREKDNRRIVEKLKRKLRNMQKNTEQND